MANKKATEHDYHAFIRMHPAIFLAITHCYLVISKLKLGSDYETDFVVVEEGYSDGTIYEMIEIESPHTKLFDSKGKPSAKFNAALQQIRDWKRYLINNKHEFKKILPTTSTKIVRDSKIRFKIVIGRRTDNLEELEKRRQIAEENNIEIISFDRFTDMIKYRNHFPTVATISSAQMKSLPQQYQNELASPFYECTNDSTWRAICKKGHFHIYTMMIEEILNVRKYNRYYDLFKKSYQSLPQNKLIN